MGKDIKLDEISEAFEDEVHLRRGSGLSMDLDVIADDVIGRCEPELKGRLQPSKVDRELISAGKKLKTLVATGVLQKTGLVDEQAKYDIEQSWTLLDQTIRMAGYEQETVGELLRFNLSSADEKFSSSEAGDELQEIAVSRLQNRGQLGGNAKLEDSINNLIATTLPEIKGSEVHADVKAAAGVCKKRINEISAGKNERTAALSTGP